MGSVKAAASKTLVVSVLLVTDVSELGRLLGVSPKKMQENGGQGALIAVTRADARRQMEEL